MMMMMNSSCVGGCLEDVQSPIEKRFMRLNQWAEADKEFLRLLSLIYKEQRQKEGETSSSPSSSSSSYSSDSPARLPTDCDQSYHCRQRYLRSYTFSRRQTAVQRTKKWLIKEKKKLKKLLNNSSSSSSGTNNNLSARGSCSFMESLLEFFFRYVAKVDVHET